MISDKRLIIWSIIGTGISSVATQLLTIREFLSQFHGNEITISLVLFCWLLLTGMGSLGAKAVGGSSLKVYALLLLTIAMWPLLQMVLIRELRDVLFTHGSSPDFYSIFFYVLITITPYCLLSGFILPHALKVLQDGRHVFTSGNLYLTDSVGDIIGGVLFSFVLVYWLNPFPIVAFTSGFLILVGLLLLVKSTNHVLFVAALCITSLFYYYATNPYFERRTLLEQYGDIILYEESPYGRVVVSREGGQYTFWESGAPLYSGTNVVASEEKIHYPLCQLDRVENVLLVSGGLGETLSEVSKYNPLHVGYVELDPNLTDAAREMGVIKRTPFLNIINTDGRRYIKMTKRKYDAIIIDLPNPDTFQENRFFTTEFFSFAKRVLKKDGILSMGIEYSPHYMSEIRKRKLSTLYNTAQTHFKKVVVLPGNYAYFLCRDGELWSDVPNRLQLKSVETSYIEDYFYGNVTKERIRQLEKSLDKNEYINTDFKPRFMNIVFREWFAKCGSSPEYFFYALLALTLVYLVFLRKEEYVLFSTGMATMGAEMLVVFTFQMVHGYIYLGIGAIITAFLLGLLPGALVGNLWGQKDTSKLITSEAFLLSLLLLFLVWTVYFRGDMHPLFLLAYCFLFSFFAGFQFPVAASIIGEKNSPAAGCLAADLCGASVGTLVTGTILIPLWGIRSAVVFLIMVKVSSTTIVVLTEGRKV